MSDHKINSPISQTLRDIVGDQVISDDRADAFDVAYPMQARRAEFCRIDQNDHPLAHLRHRGILIRFFFIECAQSVLGVDAACPEVDRVDRICSSDCSTSRPVSAFASNRRVRLAG